MQRREFFASALAAPLLADDEPRRVGVIGSGGRGRFLIDQFKEVGARVAAVCDIYQPNLRKGLEGASTGAKPFEDYRKLLEDRSLDAVVIATPDHWHSRMAIDAVEAGKDVYLEKPLAHKIDEGFALIAAVRRTRRILQVGTQRRSAEMFQRARLSMPELGDVRLVTSMWLNTQAGLTERSLEGPLDWKQWLGSAPPRELDAKRFFNWYYFWDYSGGLLVGQAAHMVDAIQWYMGSTQPAAVTCIGGRSNLAGAEVPETANLTIEYPENYLATFTLGYKTMRYNPFNDQMAQYHGSKARLDVGRESYALFPQSDAVEMKPSVDVKLPGSFSAATRSHIRNFLECTRTRKEPNAPVEAGQATNIVLCMAMESMRTGKRLKWNAAARRVES
ncbi:MAG: Gfo/Idh/MocA family oxidoreductase [Acidobacteria bacterium]|nr:Gfo/Idh/MocA family oxidoreductase [Acidobacteriota bacterium]